MKRVYKIAATLISALLLLLCSVLFFLWQDYQSFLATPIKADQLPVTITVDKGVSFRSLADSLKKQGFDTNVRYLGWHARSQDLAHRIKAGKYTFQQSPNPADLLKRFVDGQVDLYQITIVEGWTFRHMLEVLQKHSYIQHSLSGYSDAQIMSSLGRPKESPEGLFLPDTYYFPENTLDIDFLKRSMDTMTAYVDKAWSQRDENLPLQSPYEALILASIIEKETGAAHERPQIAGVFARRLQKGMRLQTDPTVIYGLGEQFDGNIRRRDLQTDTPYNTYTRYGLPPTPIALPGKAAIDAALHPVQASTLYFVARGDGTHHFSVTLEEHNQAVAKYQLGRQ